MKRWTIVATAVAVSLAFALPAAATEHEELPEGFSVDYAADDHVIVFGFDVDCSLADLMVEFTTDDDGNVTFKVTPEEDEGSGGFGFGESSDGPVDEETAPLDGCHATSVEGPNGQVNHGSIVSNTVKALKASGYEGPLGQALKDVAKSDWGKGDQKVKAKDADDEGESEGEETLEAATEKAPKGEKGNRGKGKGRG